MREESFTYSSCLSVQFVMVEKAQQQEQEVTVHIWQDQEENQEVCHSAGFLHLQSPFIQLRTPAHGTIPLTFTVGFCSSDNCLGKNALTDTRKDGAHETSQIFIDSVKLTAKRTIIKSQTNIPFFLLFVSFQSNNLVVWHSSTIVNFLLRFIMDMRTLSRFNVQLWLFCG